MFFLYNLTQFNLHYFFIGVGNSFNVTWA